MDISERKRLILSAVITLHTDSGDPVGSNILNHFLQELSVSSATLRNEMAELTSLGLLMQPHTSAGRIPTQEGMRYYVDHLMRLYPLTAGEREYIDRLTSGMDPEPDKAAEASVKVLAEMFDLAALAVTPKGANPHVVHYELMRVGRFNLAVMGVTNAGSVLSRVCRVAKEIDDDGIFAIESVLNDHLVFVSAEDATPRLLAQVSALFGGLSQTAMPVLSAAVALLRQAADARVYIDGEQNLLKYREMEHQMMAVLELFSDSGHVAQLLTSGEGQMTVLMDEDIDPRLDDTGIVIGKYHAGGLYGGLGVAGPTRLNYAYIIPRLHYFCDSLSNALKM